MKRDDRVYIQDIIDSIEIITDYVSGKTETDFEESLMLQDAVYRRFEIIGEAATKVSETFKEAHPEIEWRLMKLMRNKLIHEYILIQIDKFRQIRNPITHLKELDYEYNLSNRSFKNKTNPLIQLEIDATKIIEICGHIAKYGLS